MKNYIATIISLVSLYSCNQKDNNSDTNNKNTQTYISTSDNDSTTIIIDNEQWKKDAELYLSLKEGDTIEIDRNRPSATTKIKKTDTTRFKTFIDTEIINQNNLDFEYSDKWRKEAFKLSKQFISQILSKNTAKCKIVSQGVYNPTRVRYLGGQSYQVTITTKFDCNQDYINDCTFIISADYLGNNNWNFDVFKQWYNE